MSVHNDTLFLSKQEIVDYSILVGIDDSRKELVVGIIDYLRQYTWDKQIETGVKSLGKIAGQGAPTVISPRSYKRRFRLAMERYFMVIPGRFSQPKK
jgi:1-phosphatidylinositol-3-phosphate 5-kinase